MRRFFVCDGVDDHVQIQAACDWVADVEIGLGEYRLRTAIVVAADGTLRGAR